MLFSVAINDTCKEHPTAIRAAIEAMLRERFPSVELEVHDEDSNYDENGQALNTK